VDFILRSLNSAASNGGRSLVAGVSRTGFISCTCVARRQIRLTRRSFPMSSTGMAGQDTRLDANQLAIDGGTPVRTRPLPWEFPGAHWIGEEERALVERVVLAKSPFRYYGLEPQGMVETFEAEWKAAFGHRHVLGVSPGTAALSIALWALEIGPGDEVMVPGYLWV